MKLQLRFLKNLPETLKQIKENNIKFTSVNLYCQDESRYGLKQRAKRILTAKGVKPIQPYQHKFQNTYLYGAFSPIDGSSFILDLPYCNTAMMQLYLNQFSQHKPDELKIMITDNAAFHHTKTLIYPPNIIPIYIPPYSPELNPAERVWQYLKDKVCHRVYENLQEIQNQMHSTINQYLTKKTVISITAYQYLLDSF